MMHLEMSPSSGRVLSQGFFNLFCGWAAAQNKRRSQKMSKVRFVVAGLLVAVLVVGCGSKPEKEIQETTNAVNTVSQEGLGKYAPDDEKKLKDAMAAVQDEIKVQEGKTFKSFDKTKQMLADVKKMAEDMKAGLPAKKEQAKQNATTALDGAKAAVADAKKVLSKAPKGKGSAADIEALRGDLKGAEDSLAEAQALVDKEDYAAAVSKANAIKEKAEGVTKQVNEALEKAQGAKGKAPVKK
jgi:hypothetical protein